MFDKHRHNTCIDTRVYTHMRAHTNSHVHTHCTETGDHFCAVDGVDISTLSREEVAALFAGKPGAPLELTLCLGSVVPIKEGEAHSAGGVQLSAGGHGPAPPLAGPRVQAKWFFKCVSPRAPCKLRFAEPRKPQTRTWRGALLAPAARCSPIPCARM